VAGRAAGVEAADALRQTRERIDEMAAELTRALAEQSGLVHPSVVEGFRRGAAYRVDRLERRLRAAVKRREEEAMRDLATIRGALYPLGKRQERALNFIPLLARHGPALLSTMRAAAAAHARTIVDSEGADRAPGVPHPAAAGRA
jgi:uncharacterized protein YllA (UPF0747 family)